MGAALFLKAYRRLTELRCAGRILTAAGMRRVLARRPALAQGTALLPGADPEVEESALTCFARSLDSIFPHDACEESHISPRIHATAAKAKDDIVSLLLHTLAGDGRFLAQVAHHDGIPLAMVAQQAVYLARPVRASVRNALDRIWDVGNWRLGYCPVCGIWPRFAWIEGEPQRRFLWCLGCDSSWVFPRFRCPFCMESDQQKQPFLEPAGMASCRIGVCNSCRRYLKIALCRPCDPEAAYFETDALDTAAECGGYIRDFIGYVAFDGLSNRAAAEYFALAASH